MESTVEFPTDDAATTGSGRLFSATGGAGLGVIVVADDDSAPSHIGDVCRRLVDEGFTALALDPPGRGQSGLGAAATALAGAVDALSGHDAVRGRGVGVVGFGAGAGLALWLASLRPDEVRAAVPFYGLPAAGEEPDWARMEASVEGHFAEVGDVAPEGGAEALAARLSDLGKDVRVFTYPGTAPGFFDNTRVDVHDAEAAWQAWVRTLEFLRAKLG